MPQAIHIFRKDLHRLRWAVVGWCAIVASRTVLATAGPDISLRTAEMELAVDHLNDMLALVYVLLHFVLVSRLVHDEPLVGRNAFWITRPIAPGALMAAKLGFVGLFFLSVPLAGSIIIAGWFGTDARGIAHTIPVFLLNHLVLTTIMLVFAVLTPSLMAYIMAVIGVIAAFVLLMFVLVFAALFLPHGGEGATTSNVPEHTMDLVRGMSIVLMGLAVIVFQYRRPRLWRALVIAGIGLLVVLIVPHYWPWSLTSHGVVQTASAAADSADVAVSINPTRVSVTDGSNFSRRTAPRKEISAPVVVSGVPPALHVRGVAARGRLELSSGTVLETARRDSDAALLSYSSGAPPLRAATIQTALGGARLLTQRESKDETSISASPTLLSVADEEFVRYRAEPGRLTADVDVLLERPLVRATMPLGAGQSIKLDNLTFRIERIIPRRSGRTIVFRRSTVESLFMLPVYRDFIFVLVNRSRREAVEGDSHRGSHISLNTADLYMSSPSVGGRGFVFEQYEMGFPARATNVAWIDLSEDWFGGAELEVLEFVGAGSVTRTVTVDHFKMTP